MVVYGTEPDSLASIGTDAAGAGVALPGTEKPLGLSDAGVWRVERALGPALRWQGGPVGREDGAHNTESWTVAITSVLN